MKTSKVIKHTLVIGTLFLLSTTFVKNDMPIKTSPKLSIEVEVLNETPLEIEEWMLKPFNV